VHSIALDTDEAIEQWCTTFFGQGPLIDILNPSGARQVRRLLYVLWIQSC